MGTFALNAGLGGAAEVIGLDISEFAISQATANSKLNGLEDTVKFSQANVLDELPKLAEAGEKFDVVILDPPAFTKSREATKNAMKGGLIEELAVAFNDVDFCMKVRDKGYLVVYNPHAELYHYESKSRGYEDTKHTEFTDDRRGYLRRNFQFSIRICG